MEWVNFKVKEGEREKLKNDAHAHRMNISEYLRFLIEKERQDMRKEDEGEMKQAKCEDCVYYDELKTEQPCCGCVDFVNFECGHPTEKGGEE